MSGGNIEILAPAGSPEALTAAVRCGADAVYLGVGRFNARRAAHNFAPEDMPETVRYCHARGTAVHLALNTLVREDEMRDALQYAFSLSSPVAIRYPKNDSCGECRPKPFAEKLWVVEKEGNGAVIISVGPRMTEIALRAAEKSEGTQVVAARSVKPLDTDLLKSFAGRNIITLEENSVIGGFGAAVAEFFSGYIDTKVSVMGVKDVFVPHGTVETQLRGCGLSEDDILAEIDRLNDK